MTGRTIGAFVGGVAFALAACGGGSDPQPRPTARVAGRCPATQPSSPAAVKGEGFNHGSRALAVALWPRGRLVAGRRPDGSSWAEVNPDGSIAAKLGWRRGVGGRLSVEGERLDARASPLRADVPSGYGATGFQPTLLTFPTPGCWEVVGRVGQARLTFVVLVRTRAG